MAAIASATRVGGDSYDGFVRLHRERFTDYLRGALGRAAEGRGGRIGVEDTLQVALLRIYEEWPSLVTEPDDERDRRLYRYLRDAAGEALRGEHGRLGDRPRVVSVDFGALQAAGDDLPARDRELAAQVLGRMVRDLADAGDARDERAILDRGVLVAGLSALTSVEAVVLIAVDHLDWDQQQLADHLGLSFTALRQTLFGARKIFYSLIRHAVGIELDEEERGRLAAYMAGELKGAELRRARRHVKHCDRCQAMRREQRVFGRDAVGVLAPLPIVAGASALAKRAGLKAAIAGGGGGAALVAQPGAAKALIVVLVTLGVGAGTAAVLAGSDERVPHLHGRAVAIPVALTGPATAFPAFTRTTPKTGAGTSRTKKSKKSIHRNHTQASKQTKKRNAITNHTSSYANAAASNIINNAARPPVANSGAGAATSAPNATTGKKDGSNEFFGQ